MRKTIFVLYLLSILVSASESAKEVDSSTQKNQSIIENISTKIEEREESYELNKEKAIKIMKLDFIHKKTTEQNSN